MKKLLLIDANSLIHRSFHALPPLTTPQGESINAIYGLSGILLKILKEHQPDYAAAAFDRPEPTFRDSMYKEYKAQRPPTANELVSQLIRAREVFKQFGILTVEKAGFEADDIVGTLAEHAKNHPDLQVVIFSGDKDNLQLVNGQVVVEFLKVGVSKTITYDKSLFLQEYGFLPERLVDYKALIGDASDNIPGVKGIGPKTAMDLLKEYGTLEKIYEDIELIPKKAVQEKLKEHQADAFLSKQLATIKRDVPLELTFGDLKYIPFEKEKIKEFFGSLGFKSLVERLG
ncbi:MAG TPA: 5'-3' exonuclease H3TH domain-containing protein [Candidatus Paceibacterota bacterium]